MVIDLSHKKKDKCFQDRYLELSTCTRVSIILVCLYTNHADRCTKSKTSVFRPKWPFFGILQSWYLHYLSTWLRIVWLSKVLAQCWGQYTSYGFWVHIGHARYLVYTYVLQPFEIFWSHERWFLSLDTPNIGIVSKNVHHRIVIKHLEYIIIIFFFLYIVFFESGFL